MPVRFESNDDGGWEGAFFQFEVDDPDYVMTFQRVLHPSQQDHASGIDTVGVTYYGATAYAAVRGWEQTARDEIRLTLNPEAAAALDTDEVIVMVVEDVADLTPIYQRVGEMLTATGERPADTGRASP